MEKCDICSVEEPKIINRLRVFSKEPIAQRQWFLGAFVDLGLGLRVTKLLVRQNFLRGQHAKLSVKFWLITNAIGTTGRRNGISSFRVYRCRSNVVRARAAGTQNYHWSTAKWRWKTVEPGYWRGGLRFEHILVFPATLYRIHRTKTRFHLDREK